MGTYGERRRKAETEREKPGAQAARERGPRQESQVTSRRDDVRTGEPPSKRVN